ncbi:TIGR00366 family protein [Metallumcola ferriviriculae]|uniref:TIGR00366 family protein n=1 Tax=Metallumcola ferriviriculae TaxID=3039180 RepID=A0AAU0USM3_9FIRM|nr:TIGR00366 family protein [Desulfitibacteraceae bacterium MK1]
MLASLGAFFTKIVRKYLPDAFVFAIGLTVLTFILGIIINHQTPMQMLNHWGGGLWNLLTFSMQVSLTLVTGFILAHTAPVQKILKGAASRVTTPSGAIMAAALIASIASWLSWGFGLIVGALIARELAKNVKGVHYPLLVAAAYSGFVVWHAGLSASASLAVATPGHFLEETMGIIPVTETMFALPNLVALILIVVTLPFLFKMMMPKDPNDIMEFNPEEAAAAEVVTETTAIGESTPAQALENSRIGSFVLGLMMIVYLVYYFTQNGGLTALNLNVINLAFFALGILFVKSPKEYVDMAVAAGKNVANIIIQYPLYAGIMGMMVGSGLAATMTGWLVSIANVHTLPVFGFLSAGLVNLFVPSGGGQWAVQGPIMVPAAQQLGVDVAKVVQTVAWGDAWTNMIQPFWAIPLLGIAGLSIRDIMGYCAVTLIWTGIIISAVYMIF